MENSESVCYDIGKKRGVDNMNINQMKIFLSIVEFESFSAAAEENFMTQSNVSKIISSLENELKVKLFSRKHNHVYITKAGRQFEKFCRSTVKEYEDMKTCLHQYQMENTHHLTVALTPAAEYYDLYTVIQEYKISNPDINIYLKECTIGNVARLLETGNADLCITWLPRKNETDRYKKFSLLKLLEDEHVLIVSKGSSIASAKSVCLKELNEYPFITPINEDINKDRSELLRDNGLTPKVSCQYDSFQTQYRLVSGGFGASLSSKMIARYYQNPNICVLNIEPRLTSSIGFVYPKSNVSDLVTGFISFIRDHKTEF